MNYKLVGVLIALFFVVGNPMMYDLVDRVVPVKNGDMPSHVGVLLHALVFVLLLSVLSSKKVFKGLALKLE